MNWNDILLFDQLKDYQDKYYKLGTEYEGENWYKLYSKEEIVDGMRDLYQARWINYDEQLKNGTVIYDEYSLCGIWAMPFDMLFKCFNNECKKRYGDNLFILKAVPDGRYLHDGKEIIGDRFEVVERFNLNDIQDIGRLCESLIAAEKKKCNIFIEELNKKISSLEDEGKNIRFPQKTENRMHIRIKCVWFIIGMIFGIVLQVLFIN